MPSDPISQVAQVLSGAGLFLADGNATVLAEAHLRRWPVLAQIPDVAAVPLAVFLRGFLSGDPRPFLENGTARLAVFDPELEGIVAGHRRACLKEGVPSSMAPHLQRACEAMGLFAGEVHRHGLQTGTGTHGSGESFTVVAIAGSAADLQEAVELQRRSHAGEFEARLQMGAMLGYPRCCIEAFLSGTDRGDNLANERRPFLLHPERALHPLLHRVALPRLISHHLCSPDCAASIASAAKTLERMRTTDAPGAAWVERELSRPVLFLDYSRRCRLSGAWVGNFFEVTSCEPVGDAGWLGIPSSEVASISFMGQGPSRPLLTAPGAPLAPEALRAARGETGGGVVFSRR